MTDLVGSATTTFLLFSGELIDAPAALRTVPVDRVIDAGDLEAEVRRFADVPATRSALTQRATTEVIADLAAGATLPPSSTTGVGRRSPP